MAIVEKYTIDGADAFTLMKHKHEGHAHEWRHHDYETVVFAMTLLPSTPIYKMRGEWEAANNQGSFRL